MDNNRSILGHFGAARKWARGGTADCGSFGGGIAVPVRLLAAEAELAYAKASCQQLKDSGSPMTSACGAEFHGDGHAFLC
jgi:hypothetical protein